MELKAQISPQKTIIAKIKKHSEISARFDDVKIIKEVIRPKTYDGQYEVTPNTLEETVLDTANTFLESNVTVRKIPYYEVSNNAEGTTVYIGKEV